MKESTFTYTYMGIKFVLVCDENHELKSKYNLTKLGVDSYEQLKAQLCGNGFHDIKDGRRPAVMRQSENPKYIRFKKED